jgi:hypothetical protein
MKKFAILLLVVVFGMLLISQGAWGTVNYWLGFNDYQGKKPSTLNDADQQKFDQYVNALFGDETQMRKAAQDAIRAYFSTRDYKDKGYETSLKKAEMYYEKSNSAREKGNLKDAAKWAFQAWWQSCVGYSSLSHRGTENPDGQIMTQYQFYVIPRLVFHWSNEQFNTMIDKTGDVLVSIVRNSPQRMTELQLQYPSEATTSDDLATVEGQIALGEQPNLKTNINEEEFNKYLNKFFENHDQMKAAAAEAWRVYAKNKNWESNLYQAERFYKDAVTARDQGDVSSYAYYCFKAWWQAVLATGMDHEKNPENNLDYMKAQNIRDDLLGSGIFHWSNGEIQAKVDEATSIANNVLAQLRHQEYQHRQEQEQENQPEYVFIPGLGWTAQPHGSSNWTPDQWLQHFNKMAKDYIKSHPSKN